jgi:periplasmic divalent cation tolerance protein
MLIAWTTVSTRADADRLAAAIVERRLAACVQIEGPVRSVYRWKGRPEQADEFRLCLKFLASQSGELTSWVMANHPYETPEWVVVQADQVGEKYLSWARANSTNPTL